ncbi:cytochrome P450 [Rhizorhabdus dicambivorans]|uniref:Cytochrome P450 n=1 Tax=Rhizorhabdus dicambivorans TaxID=1850238 RepID=A0A2A4FPV9_9SPHN|nr:cytochrome P450 [Rhizorhabdus dicambivorans]ATE66318.1 cytochrome P450 [Rhizorhabdus dicambivorans]PCE40149.1 cytochrome P450 [Rhizorhabdus dicambivorans]
MLGTADQTRQAIPQALVDADFDMFALKVPDGDAQIVWTEVRDTHPPIFWTNQNGGHWVFTRADDIEAAQKDHEHFSMREGAIPKGRRGIPSPPIDVDPPRHFAYRAVLSPAFSPKAVAALETVTRSVLLEAIDKVIDKGECEFVSEIAHVLPITVFLKMMGLPLEDAKVLLPLSHQNTQAKELVDTQAARAGMVRYIIDKIEDRRASPGSDVLSHVVHSKVDGQPIAEQDLLGMCALLLAGGLDTVASMLGFFARFLALNPGHREDLVANPDRIPKAIDELIRRHGVANTARIMTADYNYKGVLLRKDDMVLVPNCLHGLDPQQVNMPLEVDFDRPPPIPSAAFGNGPHRCPGIALARMEMKVFLQEWLKRIPEFRIKSGTTPVATIGATNSMQELWLSWG